MKFSINPFVLRQVPDSPFSFYAGDINDVAEMAGENFAHAVTLYRDGVVGVMVPPEGFFSGIVTLTDGTELTGSYRARKEGETPRKEVLAKGGTKLPAAQVQVVLYRSDVLAEDDENSLEPSEDNWEVISINASPLEGDMPINPITLMHNHFGSDGGTATNLSDKDFVAMLRAGFDFWADKAMAG